MKNLVTQYERASAELADRLRKLIDNLRPGMQCKFGFTDAMMSVAIADAVGAVAVERLGEVQATPEIAAKHKELVEMLTGPQTHGSAVGP